MASIHGRITTCDRCGEIAVSKCTGDGEADGGYTRWNKFEPLPEGWAHYPSVGDLCPKCNADYLKIVENFKNDVNEFNNRKIEG